MESERAIRGAEAIDEISKWGVGTGIVLFALFPLSIPILILTAVALLPLAVPLLVLAVLAVPVLLARALWRRVRRPRRTQKATPSRGPLLASEPVEERVA